MKSSLLIITLIFCLSASAQIQKGSIFLGGDIGFNHTKQIMVQWLLKNMLKAGYQDKSLLGQIGLWN